MNYPIAGNVNRRLQTQSVREKQQNAESTGNIFVDVFEVIDLFWNFRVFFVGFFVRDEMFVRVSDSWTFKVISRAGKL